LPTVNRSENKWWARIDKHIYRRDQVKLDIKYQYEPLLRVEDRKFYPDFKTGDNIIECCYWESEDRWLYLAVKFSLYIMALVSTAFLLQNNYAENIFI